VTESTTKARYRSVVSGLVLAVPMAAAALASAPLVAYAPAAHQPHSTNATCVSVLCTTAGTGGGDPKIPEFVGD
jgi:hypothetical protein